MLTTLFLHGRLGNKFGRKWEFDASTPGELIRTLCRFRPDFGQAMFDSEKQGTTYRVVVDGKEISFCQRLAASFNGEVHLWPIVIGSKRAGVFQTIIGVIIVAAAVYYEYQTGFASGGATIKGAMKLAFSAGGFTQFAAMMGAAMTVGGIAQMIANPQPLDASNLGGDNKRSYLFGGAVGTTQQGAAIPVGYGRLHIGPIVVSAGMFAERLPIPAVIGGVDTDGDGILDDFDGDGIPDEAKVGG